MIIDAGETATFNVVYRPVEAQRSQAHIRLSVVDNQYEDSTLQLVGEGYVDDITLDNITCIPQSIAPEDQEGNMAEDDVSGRWRWAVEAVLLVMQCDVDWTAQVILNALSTWYVSSLNDEKKIKYRPFSQFLAIDELLLFRYLYFETNICVCIREDKAVHFST